MLEHHTKANNNEQVGRYQLWNTWGASTSGVTNCTKNVGTGKAKFIVNWVKWITLIKRNANINVCRTTHGKL